jgi:hypothetical protein
MAEIHTLRISFDGALQSGPKPWMWATVEVVLEDEGKVHPSVTVRAPVPFEGQGVFEMRELAWTAFRETLEGALAAGDGKRAEQLSFSGA